ncbi:MAG: HipA domain-containing protein [Campylobacterales bacterium]|nr:HipA domain-containing protein [Campylobacterales bacterium]
MQKVFITIFDQHVATMYQNDDRIFLEQVNDMCHKLSPLRLSPTIKEIDTTPLVHLEKVAGFISDALPGSFGNEILKNFFLQHRRSNPTVSDKLLFIGNRGLGALTFEPSVSKEDHTEHTLALKSMFDHAREIQRGGHYHALQDVFLVGAHSFVGGARSKAVCAISLDTKTVFLGDRTKPLEEGLTHVIVKYDESEKKKSVYSTIEYIYYCLAKQCGLDISQSYLLEADGRHHFVTTRFDIEPSAKRYHVHSLAGLLHLDYALPRTIGYEDLLRTAVQLGAQSSLQQLFLQMLFNYMFVNQDDHSRNFSFMCDKDFKWRATPAYDLTFAQGGGQTVEHQLSLYGKPLSTIGLDEIAALATEFSLEMEFVALALELMKKVREDELPRLLKAYAVDTPKQEQIRNAVNKRTLKGAL